MVFIARGTGMSALFYFKFSLIVTSFILYTYYRESSAIRLYAPLPQYWHVRNDASSASSILFLTAFLSLPPPFTRWNAVSIPHFIFTPDIHIILA